MSADSTEGPVLNVSVRCAGRCDQWFRGLAFSVTHLCRSTTMARPRSRSLHTRHRCGTRNSQTYKTIVRRQIFSLNQPLLLFHTPLPDALLRAHRRPSISIVQLLKKGFLTMDMDPEAIKALMLKTQAHLLVSIWFEVRTPLHPKCSTGSDQSSSFQLLIYGISVPFFMAMAYILLTKRTESKFSSLVFGVTNTIIFIISTVHVGAFFRLLIPADFLDRNLNFLFHRVQLLSSRKRIWIHART